MLSFLQPISLLAAATIVVPVIIHLWNVKKGKTLKVGSIVFFKENAKSHAKSLQLSEWLLLLLRCLLLIVLSVAIAGPFDETKETSPGWVIIEKGQVQHAYRYFKPAIDSLLASGFSFHYLNPDDEPATFEDALKFPPDTSLRQPLSYWSLLTLLEKKIPSDLPVHLFTDNRLTRFTGNRPSVSLPVKWRIFPSSDTLSRWIETSHHLQNDSIRIVTGKSTPDGVQYAYQNITANSPGHHFVVKRTNRNLHVNYTDPSVTPPGKPIIIDTTSLRIIIYLKKTDPNAAYLEAAIDAIREFTKRPMQVSVVRTVQKIPSRYDWLFWLSEEMIPSSIIQNNVFKYEKGKVQQANSQMFGTGFSTAFTAGQIPVFQSNIPDPSAELRTTLWQNGFGEPLLTVEKQNATIYRFYSRFDPQWNDLVWSNEFPGQVYNLLFNRPDLPTVPANLDRRVIDVAQIPPVITSDKTLSAGKFPNKKDLSNLFWMIAFILFTAERIIALAGKKEVQNG